jgi:hypothetical protein
LHRINKIPFVIIGKKENRSNTIRGLFLLALKRLSVYLGSKTAMEDRLSGNIEAIYNNLDRA